MPKIEHLGHSAFRLTGNKTIYIDPYKLTAPQIPADIVLVTHNHFDHCSPSDLAIVCTSSTVVYATADCSETLKQIPVPITHRIVEPNRKYEFEGIKIRTIPAYNIGKKFHPKTSKWVGYIVEFEGESFYHTGDSDLIPEMEGLEPDYAFLPVSGVYVMDSLEAAEAYRMVRPKKGVYPMHFGVVVGTKEDAAKFLELIKKSK